MARVCILSSWVADGHVGLAAGAPVLQRLGHDVVGIPTTVLSNHPGLGPAGGASMAPGMLARLIAALDGNGALAGLDACLVGYLPSPAHVTLAADLLGRIRAAAPRSIAVVDPVLGDDPGGLYMPEDVARAVRTTLLPLADTLTPNRFELEWLSGRPCPTPEACLDAANALAGDARRAVHVTSAPLPGGETGVLVTGPEGAEIYATPSAEGVPHGTGDVYAALIAAGLSPGAALGQLDAMVRESLGARHLSITQATAWLAAPALQARPFPDPAPDPNPDPEV